MLLVTDPLANVRRAAGIVESARAVPLPIGKFADILVMLDKCRSDEAFGEPCVLSVTMLNAVSPVTTVHLALGMPSHGSSTVPHIVTPLTLIYVTRTVIDLQVS